MPKLKSGRHVGIELVDYKELFKHGSSEKLYYLIISYRLSVRKPEDIVPLLQVVYFEDGKGEPPDAPKYLSGYTVNDIFNNNVDWTRDEISEFQNWIDNSKELEAYLTKSFNDIDLAIRDSPVWSSEFMTSK